MHNGNAYRVVFVNASRLHSEWTMNASPVQHTGETLPFEYYLLYLESLVPRYIKRYYGTLKFWILLIDSPVCKKKFFAVVVSNIMLNQELQELRKVLQVCINWKMKMSISHCRHWDILKCFIWYWFAFLYRKFPIHWTNLGLRKPAV